MRCELQPGSADEPCREQAGNRAASLVERIWEGFLEKVVLSQVEGAPEPLTLGGCCRD